MFLSTGHVQLCTNLTANITVECPGTTTSNTLLQLLAICVQYVALYYPPLHHQLSVDPVMFIKARLEGGGDQALPSCLQHFWSHSHLINVEWVVSSCVTVWFFSGIPSCTYNQYFIPNLLSIDYWQHSSRVQSI